MNYSWHDLLGNIGVLLILTSYLLLQLGKWSASSLTFSVANGVGALFILVTLWFEFNLSAFIVELFWLLISLLGIARYLRRASARASLPE